MDDHERNQIIESCQKGETLWKIMKFNDEFIQVSSMDAPNLMYMNCCLNDHSKSSNEETTIIKMDCNDLQCSEVYWSKFKIIHIAVVENKDTDQDSSYSESSLEEASKGEDSVRGITIRDQSNPSSKGGSPVVIDSLNILPEKELKS